MLLGYIVCIESKSGYVLSQAKVNEGKQTSSSTFRACLAYIWMILPVRGLKGEARTDSCLMLGFFFVAFDETTSASLGGRTGGRKLEISLGVNERRKGTLPVTN